MIRRPSYPDAISSVRFRSCAIALADGRLCVSIVNVVLVGAAGRSTGTANVSARDGRRRRMVSGGTDRRTARGAVAGVQVR